MAQRVSSAGLAFLVSEEGLAGLSKKDGKYYPYKDPIGKLTMGVGHLVLPHENFSQGLTLTEVMNLFRKDVERFELAIDTGVMVRLTDHQRSAFLSFIFNVGASKANQEYSTPTRQLNLGRYDLWPESIKMYDKADGEHKPWLLARRKREGAYFKLMDKEPNNDAVLTDEDKAAIIYSVSQSIRDNLTPHELPDE